MNPKWAPQPLTAELTPFGEEAFQPYLDKGKGVVIAGGSAALCIVSANESSDLLATIPAQARITGFAVHAGELFVQDGPVLSRWALTDGLCLAAINLFRPREGWQRSSNKPLNWAELHKLPAAQAAKQSALLRARRKVEWLALLEAGEALRRDGAAARSAAETTQLDAMIADLAALVGNNRGQLRAELATAEQDSAQVIFSAPAVRTHQLGAKAGALVYVLARDGVLHPLDAKLGLMNTSRLDRSARPALALVEQVTEAHSDDYACRLFYVAGDGLVRAVEGNSLPAQSAGEWPARGSVSLQPGIRPRVAPLDDKQFLFWGSSAQGSGVFALASDQPGSASRISVPAGEDWQWLELPKAGSVALMCTSDTSRLVAYADNTVLAERWGARTLAPHYSSFIEVPDKPLLVAEFEREKQGQNAGPVFRALVANMVDGTDRRALGWYPPPPEVIKTDILQGYAGKSAPVSIRTQVTISLQDAYLIACDKTKSEQMRALITDGAGSWQAYRTQLLQTYADLSQASQALGELSLPRLAGAHALYCYKVGDKFSKAELDNARAYLQRMRELVVPLFVRIGYYTADGAWGGTHVNTRGGPLANTRVTLRFSNGETVGGETDANGDFAFPVTKLGLSATASAYTLAIGPGAQSSTCVLGRTGNSITLTQINRERRHNDDPFDWRKPRS